MSIVESSFEASVSANVLVGEQVRLWLRRRGRSQRDLAEALEIRGPSLSRKIQGVTGWTINDLVTTAAFLDLQIRDLLPDAAIEVEKVRIEEKARNSAGDQCPRLDSNQRPIA